MEDDFCPDPPLISMPIELGPHNYMSLLLEPFDNFLFDLDGTAWREDGLTPIEDFKRTYDLLKAMGKNTFFITNGGHMTRQQLAEKIKRVNGIKDVTKVRTDEVMEG